MENAIILGIECLKEPDVIQTPRTGLENRDYYGGISNPYETIKVIEAWGLGFSLGNAVKYISRCKFNTNEDRIEDLKKSQNLHRV